MLPCCDNCQVVAEEADSSAMPLVSPSEGGRYDGEELLPLDGQLALVRLPWVVEPCPLKVCTTAECPGGIGIELKIVCCHPVWVDEVSGAVP